MAVDKHPSRKPSEPAVPRRTTTTSGTDNKIEAHDGKAQGGGDYGFRHELHVKDPSKSEMSHHFESHKSHSMAKHERSSRPGDENKADEPG